MSPSRRGPLAPPALLALAAVAAAAALHCAGVGAATPAERRALLDFKSAITSDPDAALASWTPAADPCSDFAGITCDPTTGAVQRLRLHGARLSGALSPSLAALPALESISLFGNALTGPIPPAYSALSPTLHKLNLSRNALSGPIPAFLTGCIWLCFTRRR